MKRTTYIGKLIFIDKENGILLCVLKTFSVFNLHA